MITREMLIDAVGRLMADVTDGTWGLSDDCMHPAIVELYDHLPTVPEPVPFRPVEYYAPVGAKMADAIERLDDELNAIKLVLDAHRAALATAGLLNADGTLPTPKRQPRVWAWSNVADRDRPVLPALSGGDTWRTRDRHGIVHDWKAGPAQNEIWELTWRKDLRTKGPMTEVINDDE